MPTGQSLFVVVRFIARPHAHWTEFVRSSAIHRTSHLGEYRIALLQIEFTHNLELDRTVSWIDHGETQLLHSDEQDEGVLT